MMYCILFLCFQQIYDHSIIPRIAISLIMAIFGIIAIVNLIDHFGESKKVGST